MRYRWQWGDAVYQIDLERHEDSFKALIDGTTYVVEVLDSQPGQLSLSIDGKPMTLIWAVDGSNKWIALEGCSYRLERPAPTRIRGGEERSGENVVRAPMPAQVRAIYAVEGDPVQAGETLLLLEAMKMEIRVVAPRGGTIQKIQVAEGETVNRDQELVEIGE